MEDVDNALRILCLPLENLPPYVDIDANKSVDRLKKEIKNKNEDIKDPTRDLQLFLTKTKDNVKHSKWLRSDAAAVIRMQSGSIPEEVKKLLNKEIDPIEKIGDLFEGAPMKKTIHVLVRVPSMTQNESMPPLKRVKLVQKDVTYQGPVPLDAYSVPMETIEAYQKLQKAFSSRERVTYKRIRKDFENLCESDWKLLALLLKDDAGGSGAQLNIDPGKLLRMGIVMYGASGTTLEFSSEMMRRLCLEALPVREIQQVTNADDPLELFAVSLRFMNPVSVRQFYVKNKLFPSESVFQFELYASIRGIFKANNILTKNILAEARDPYDKQKGRQDIIISNEIKYGYELRSNQLNETEIIAAVRQADGYRQLLNISTMFMVNFVPRSHSLQQPVYNVEECPEIKIIYVFFPDTCDEFTLQLEGKGGVIETRTIRCA